MADDYAGKLALRYNQEASAYQELWAPILRTGGIRLLREFTDQNVRRILDVGSGVGILLPDLRSQFPEAQILSIDRSPGMLALAPQGFPRVVMDAAHLAIASQSVDLVLLVFMLFHLEKPIDGLREACRVVRPGGQVGTLTWAGNFQSPATRVWSECLDQHGAVKPDPIAEERHDPVNLPEKVAALLSRAGFNSPRAWMEELVGTMNADHIIRMRTTMGSERPRFDSLDLVARQTCVSVARRRMEAMVPEDFVARGNVVYAAASAPR